MLQKGHEMSAECAGVGTLVNKAIDKTANEATGNESLSVTEKAAGKIKYFLAKEKKEDYGFRLKVKKGGCSGYTYDFGLAEKPEGNEIVVEQYGVKIFMDEFSRDYLKGSIVDYAESLMQSGFMIRNPNTKESCKCGHSFK